MKKEFESISPYNDEQAVRALARVSKNPFIPVISKYLFPDFPSGTLKAMLQSVGSIDEFQDVVMRKVVVAIVAKTSEGVSFDGIENAQALGKTKFLAISNHRDIILDPALTQWLFLDNGVPMTEICVGSNLLSSRMVEDLMRSNRMIKVIRGISARELYLSSKLLSQYIRESITSNRSSVWIAQKEGRAKNGYDVTEQGLLKMFDMSGEEDFATNFKNLHIIPISISYEYESCDAKKARELYLKERDGSYKKKKREDLHSILTGIRQRKGHIHLSFGAELTDEEISRASQYKGNERYQELMRILDNRIVSGYKIWNNNYIAYDLLYPGNKYAIKYTEAERNSFIAYAKHKIDKLERKLDRDRLTQIFYSIYANPVVHKEQLGLL